MLLPPAGSFFNPTVDGPFMHIDKPRKSIRCRDSIADLLEPEDPESESHIRAAGHQKARDDRIRCIDSVHRKGHVRMARSHSPVQRTKSGTLLKFKAFGVLPRELGIENVHGRRHIEEPRLPEPRNEIVRLGLAQHFQRHMGRHRSFSRTRVVAAGPPDVVSPRNEVRGICLSPRDALERGQSVESDSPRARGQFSRNDMRMDYPSLDLSLDGAQGRKPAPKSPTSQTPSGKSAPTAMNLGLRRLDTCALKLEEVAQALVRAAQQQSMKRLL